jgi:hypothetical protein
MDMIRARMHGKKVPSTELADAFYGLQHNRAALIVKQVWRLRHFVALVSFKPGPLANQPRSNLIVLRIDRAASVAVKVRTVSGKRDQVGHEYEVFRASGISLVARALTGRASRKTLTAASEARP